MLSHNLPCEKCFLKRDSNVANKWLSLCYQNVVGYRVRLPPDLQHISHVVTDRTLKECKQFLRPVLNVQVSQRPVLGQAAVLMWDWDLMTLILIQDWPNYLAYTHTPFIFGSIMEMWLFAWRKRPEPHVRPPPPSPLFKAGYWSCHFQHKHKLQPHCVRHQTEKGDWRSQTDGSLIQ